MPEPAQSPRKRGRLRHLGLAGRLWAPLILGALPGLVGVPAACGGGPRLSHPPVSTAPVAPAEPSQEPEGASRPIRGTVHVVEPGETLWGIGRRYGIPVQELMRANDIGPGEVTTLQVGRTLRIPATPGSAAETDRRARARPAPAAPARRARSEAPSTELLAAAHLGQARDRYDAADFEGALADARAAGRLLEGLQDSPAHRDQRARACLLEGMAQAALGDTAGALSSFRDARRLDPGLSLDPGTTSPKLVSLFDRAGGTP